MAERRSHDRSIQFQHAFDRLLAVKLEQVYEILVPEQARELSPIFGDGLKDQAAAVWD